MHNLERKTRTYVYLFSKRKISATWNISLIINETSELKGIETLTLDFTQINFVVAKEIKLEGMKANDFITFNSMHAEIISIATELTCTSIGY